MLTPNLAILGPVQVSFSVISCPKIRNCCHNYLNPPWKMHQFRQFRELHRLSEPCTDPTSETRRSGYTTLTQKVCGLSSRWCLEMLLGGHNKTVLCKVRLSGRKLILCRAQRKYDNILAGPHQGIRYPCATLCFEPHYRLCGHLNETLHIQRLFGLFPLIPLTFPFKNNIPQRPAFWVSLPT